MGCHSCVEVAKAKLQVVFTRDFLKLLVGGQILSLLICGTAITSQLLNSEHGINAPTAQSFLNYVLLTAVYCTQLCYRQGDNNFYNICRQRWWKYLLVALVDVEANYFVVKAYQYTTLTSVQLLDCITIPVVLLLSFVILKTKFFGNHVVGVVVCLIGVPLMIWADLRTGRSHSGGASDKLLGDMLCIVGASLYGVSNIAEEYAVRFYTRTEFLGLVGLFGSFICGIQLIIFEREELIKYEWSWQAILLLLGFAICLFSLYSLMPTIIRLSSAMAVNLSILTADIYSLLIGLFVFHYTFSFLYFLSFVTIVLGIVLYSLKKTGVVSSNDRYREFQNDDAQANDPEVNIEDDDVDKIHETARRCLNGDHDNEPEA
ncbi:solute carrier family 35 member F1-like [Anneissia japonica]|uniref:solute carrier family 35 member F1-like n=1 Tax=Anneissia japonica TaxID=1529436 RepID=UPI0014259BB9|nr:solute carrier family 35 member F1-like [Anneissia japonica]XP_033100401.1 solute carrier family 35 member F1-like [Anneissia japonica]